MWNVTELARACGTSRGAVLYYEGAGLIKPALRTASGYRRYGEREAERLRKICAYRSAGLTVDDIRKLIERRQDGDAASVLHRRLATIAEEIDRLREHQRSILALLKHRRLKAMTKDKWVSIMRSAGLTEENMHRWHTEFEKAAPEDHQEFLAYLKIPAEEISRIRDWSRGQTVR